jgi:hypothetical protein
VFSCNSKHHAASHLTHATAALDVFLTCFARCGSPLILLQVDSCLGHPRQTLPVNRQFRACVCAGTPDPVLAKR